jgi:hypothetical protein
MVAAISEVHSAAPENFVRPESMHRKSLIVSLASFALLASLSLRGNARSPAAGQQSRAKQSSAKTKAAPAIPAKPDAVVPFAIGETLEYQVLWTQYRVHAATLEYSVVEKRDFFGHPAWHFRIMAHTTNTMRTVYPLDDQFDSYTDAVQLTSLQYEQYLRELNSPQNNVYRMSSGAEPAPAGASAVKVLPGTRDAVGIVYALRANDWASAPELDAPVFDGHNIYDVHARVDAATDMVQVPAGQLPATRITVDIYEGGKLKQGTRFQVWLGKDAARTPLLIEAIVPIGNARVELLSLPKR